MKRSYTERLFDSLKAKAQHHLTIVQALFPTGKINVSKFPPGVRIDRLLRAIAYLQIRMVRI